MDDAFKDPLKEEYHHIRRLWRRGEMKYAAEEGGAKEDSGKWSEEPAGRVGGEEISHGGRDVDGMASWIYILCPMRLRHDHVLLRLPCGRTALLDTGAPETMCAIENTTLGIVISPASLSQSSSDAATTTSSTVADVSSSSSSLPYSSCLSLSHNSIPENTLPVFDKSPGKLALLKSLEHFPLLNEPIHVLLGDDVLSRFACWNLDAAAGWATFCLRSPSCTEDSVMSDSTQSVTKATAYSGSYPWQRRSHIALSTLSFQGIPTIPITITDKQLTAYVDTGAPVSYIPTSLHPGHPVIRVFKDWSPLIQQEWNASLCAVQATVTGTVRTLHRDGQQEQVVGPLSIQLEAGTLPAVLERGMLDQGRRCVLGARDFLKLHCRPVWFSSPLSCLVLEHASGR